MLRSYSKAVTACILSCAPKSPATWRQGLKDKGHAGPAHPEVGELPRYQALKSPYSFWAKGVARQSSPCLNDCQDNAMKCTCGRKIIRLLQHRTHKKADSHGGRSYSWLYLYCILCLHLYLDQLAREIQCCSIGNSDKDPESTVRKSQNAARLQSTFVYLCLLSSSLRRQAIHTPAAQNNCTTERYAGAWIQQLWAMDSPACPAAWLKPRHEGMTGRGLLAGSESLTPSCVLCSAQQIGLAVHPS